MTRDCAICGARVKRAAAIYCSLACREARRGTLDERFWSKVDRRGPDECWPWIAGRCGGYGRFSTGGGKKARPAAQIAWELANALPFPDRMLACHSCDNPPCCNPAHIWPGTHADNVRDAVAKGRMHEQRVTHCPHGHEYSPSNTLMAGNRRQCRECNRAKYRAWAPNRKPAPKRDPLLKRRRAA